MVGVVMTPTISLLPLVSKLYSVKRIEVSIGSGIITILVATFLVIVVVALFFLLGIQ